MDNKTGKNNVTPGNNNAGESGSLVIELKTRLVGFAGASVNITGNTNNNPTVSIPFGFNISSAVASGNGNDTRRVQITFATSHPNRDDYIVTVSKPSHEPNGDERKIQWKAASKTPNGFIMELATDDNGGAEDPNTFHGFDFVVYEEIEFISAINSPNIQITRA